MLSFKKCLILRSDRLTNFSKCRTLKENRKGKQVPMYRLCSTEKAVEQQRMLCDSFLSLLLTEEYDDITISQICRNANLSRNVFYRLF